MFIVFSPITMKQRKFFEFERGLDKWLNQIKNDPILKKGLITRQDILSISSLRKSKPEKRRFSFITAAGVLVSLVLFWFSVNYARNSLQRSDSDRCLVPLPGWLQNGLVPANDCGFCRNITGVDRVHSISRESFAQKYAYTKIPVVITDAMVNWTAPHVFNFEFFKKLYLDDDRLSDGRGRKNCQFFPYKTEFRSLEEVFRMDPLRANYTEGTKPWYIGWSNCDHRIANKLRSHYQKPYFLPIDSESIRTDWIFMGTPNNGAHMHIDHVGLPSWQAQLQGTKRWSLNPPHECYLDCKDLTVDVKQGDIIVLDTNVWYHSTLIIGDRISLTIGAEYD